MILQKLTMKNFRQFRGTQEIGFASDGPERVQEVTVIFGENGRGKTGIFLAIMFCLYGDQHLSQDSHIAAKELTLVNMAELHDSGEPVDCFVQFDFMHAGLNYSLKRTVLGMKHGDEIIEQRDEVRLICQTAG